MPKVKFDIRLPWVVFKNFRLDLELCNILVSYIGVGVLKVHLLDKLS